MRVALVAAGMVANVAEFDTLQRAVDLFPAYTCVDVTALDCGPGWSYDGSTFTAPVVPSAPHQGWKTPLYMSQGDKLIQNTTVETSSGSPSARGSALLPADFITPTRLIEFKQFGVVSTGASPVTLTARLKLAGGTVLSVIYNLPANLNNVYWELEGKIMGRTLGLAGSLVAAMTLNGPANASITPAPVTVNTQQSNQLDLTFQWGAAAAGNKLLVFGTFLEATT